MKEIRKLVFSLIIVVLAVQLIAAQGIVRQKLFVGIVVDQMREDFLFRFYDQYGSDGFKRLMNDGFMCRNVHFNYIPTITAV